MQPREMDVVANAVGPTLVIFGLVLLVVFLCKWLTARARAAYFATRWGQAEDKLEKLRRHYEVAEEATPFPEDDEEDDDDDFERKLLRNPEAWKEK